MLRQQKSVDDGAGVAAFEPAIGGDGATAGPVGAGVHHDNTVPGAQQKFRLADDSDAVVGDAVEKEDPAPVGFFRSDFPTPEERAIRRANVEVLAGCASEGEGSAGFADEIGRQFAANGMEKRRSGEPSGYRGEERREEQQDQGDTDQTAAHGCYPKIREFALCRSSNRRRMLR